LTAKNWNFNLSPKNLESSQYNHQYLINGAKTMSYYSHVGMVNIPAIKMLMTGGWFMALFYPHYRLYFFAGFSIAMFDDL